MGTGASAGISAAITNTPQDEVDKVLGQLSEGERAKLRSAITAAAEKAEKAEKKTVCICGAGNAAHVFIPYFSKLGYNVTVFADFGDEAERLQKGIDENDGILIHDRCDPKNIKEYKGKPSIVSRNAAEAVPQADYIIAALPSFAVKNVLTGIKDHLKKGAIVYIMPGQGGPDFVAKDVLGARLAPGDVTMAGIIPMPLNCRITDWGKRVELAALKANYDLASVPANEAPRAAEALSKLLEGRPVNAIGNYVGIHLHASNPNLHPGRLYGLFGPDSQLGLYEEGKVYKENPLFYETWDDRSSEWVQKISDERCNVWAKLCEKFPGTGKAEQVPAVKPYIEAIYAGQIGDSSTLSGCFNTNDGFKGFRCPMKEVEGGFVPDFKNRYFTEDFPEGFAMYKGISDLAGVDTPVIDEIFAFFQKFMGKEYVKDGKFSGADIAATKSPQAFGVTTIEVLLKDEPGGAARPASWGWRARARELCIFMGACAAEIASEVFSWQGRPLLEQSLIRRSSRAKATAGG
eukprot:CAMPEP_0179341112 /NCGR_PEP_ID=MMETSP0797-20121207/69662_1 /TAXON_ID=47934 /ORGANISM="Dinophysis acuminata, Strain DAEP01" /LENGTH=517 /DNA_ID=CAMNT_0021055163 /DNA_START=1 /DNA_END=1551 /DNA_ORIENTATION=-